MKSKKKINIQIVLKILGMLLVLEGIFMLISLPFSIYYGEDDFYPIVMSAAITLGIGFISYFKNRNAVTGIRKREGYILVSLVWVVFSIFGALPFVISGYIPNITNAFFETMSGFTTTGASILNDIESVPHGLLFWRSMTQWLGGMGIIVLSLAILPILGIGGMQLYIAEVPGPAPDKLHPKVTATAKRLWVIYAVFTIVETIFLLFGGMDFFDAINHSLTTMATGGYSTKQASIAYFNSPFIEYVIIVFMFIAGMNFSLSYFALKGNFSKVWKNEEFKYYLGFVIGITLIISVALFFSEDYSIEKSFRDALFQVVSIMTTTGYVTADYLSWMPFLMILILMIMFFGGSAGSTGGSMKIVRIVLMLKNSILELKRLIIPNVVINLKFNNQSIPQATIFNVLAFIVFYILIFVLGVIVMSTIGLDLESSMGAVAATLGNIGPGIGSVGPMDNFYAIPDFGKWFLSFLMLLGRLEIFTVLVLFSPRFWKK